MAVVLLLGANGFLGSHITDFLSANHTVIAVDRYSRPPQFNPHTNIHIFKDDLNNLSIIKDILKNNHRLFVFDFLNGATPFSSLYQQDNILEYTNSFKKRLDLYATYNVRRVIFPSSAGTLYLNSVNQNGSAENDIVDPQNPYALNKYTSEKELELIYKQRGLDYLILRISSAYGIRQSWMRDQGVISVFLYSILKNGNINVFGSLHNERDFIYVDDIAGVINRMFDAPLKHHVYNLGSGYTTSINQIIELFRTKLHLNFSIKHLPERASDRQRIAIDTSRIQSEFPFPVTLLLDGLQKTYDDIRSRILGS